MALKIHKIGSPNYGIGYDDSTGESGPLIAIVNGTGSASVKGSVVSCSPSADNKFVLQSNEFDSFGIVAESGKANDALTWVWKVGARCQVLFKDGESATRGYVCLAADTDGRAYNIAVPSSNPVVSEHFKEIGHSCESKNSGTDVLVLIDLHCL